MALLFWAQLGRKYLQMLKFEAYTQVIEMSNALEGKVMRNHNQLRTKDETMDQFKARRARGVIANIASFVAECREGAGWPPERENQIAWFHHHRARLREKIAAAPKLP